MALPEFRISIFVGEGAHHASRFLLNSQQEIGAALLRMQQKIFRLSSERRLTALSTVLSTICLLGMLHALFFAAYPCSHGNHGSDRKVLV
jgi:hypothetical protein